MNFHVIRVANSKIGTQELIYREFMCYNVVMDYHKAIENGEYLIVVYVDGDPDSPREWDNLGTMTCFHSHYVLGDKEHDFWRGYYNADGWELYDDDLESLERFCARPDVIALPLTFSDYGSGQVTIKVGDWNKVGYIYVKAEKVRSEYGWKRITSDRRKKIEDYLKNEVETYNQFLTGETFGYHVYRKEDCTYDPFNYGSEWDCDGIDSIDSCWGYYGDDFEKNGLLESANNYIEYIKSKPTCTKCPVYCMKLVVTAAKQQRELIPA